MLLSEWSGWGQRKRVGCLVFTIKQVVGFPNGTKYLYGGFPKIGDPNLVPIIARMMTV